MVFYFFFCPCSENPAVVTFYYQYFFKFYSRRFLCEYDLFTEFSFCTPGILVNARALLDRNTDPTDEEIREALVGNLCRCTGYIRIIDAVKIAARQRREVLP